ncbi:endoplasmic reticulum-golgi intermediate compartment-domain-containing protein [Dissophora ornata]|nr:endoplasmic reticulum-golgi intermediate compartment-domain-containing protein [Dissophora ornata]
MQFKEFDAFPKVESGFVKRTGSGGILTLVISAILCVLVVGEIRDYMTLRNDYKFLVDPLVNHELQINLDITVAMPCDALTLDLRDIAEVQLRLSDKVHKIPTHPPEATQRPEADQGSQQDCCPGAGIKAK